MTHVLRPAFQIEALLQQNKGHPTTTPSSGHPATPTKRFAPPFSATPIF
jgi:hypothetical protein